MRMCLALSLPAMVVLGFVAMTPTQAEPYLAVANGFKCSQCHVNPTGGGQRTAFGEVFSQTLLPARHLDTGADTWAGELNRFVALGGDLRYDASSTEAPRTRTLNQFQMQQTRAYLEASVIPERLLVYVDEQVAPGGALNREAWGMYWSSDHSWYLKAGQMYLPFGWRLQDQTAFILQASGINMTTPDQGIELGWLKGHWDAQLAVSNGTAGGPASGNGKQTSAQLSWVSGGWRLGSAANYDDAGSDGSRSAFALFAGLRTGPVAWLAQAELIDDHTASGAGGGSAAGGAAAGLQSAATLIEADIGLARGQNVKVTQEFLDPDRAVGHAEQTRWSVVYELTPVQFVQLRAGARYGDGIPQLPLEHTRLYFLELHGFF
ncbi:MAG: hypothetical protein JO361_12555 [Gammaproteobacteria bacterium]|nr:hypothetical protein [Gammaproteobacteria bacterium]